MAVVGNASYPTLMDFQSRSDAQGNITMVIEQLAAINEILKDIPFVEGNLPTGHQTTVRVGLPTPTWRKLNYGVLPTKGQTVKVTDTCGMLEDYAVVDKALADLNGNSAAWRMSEDSAHIESMSQTVASTLFYGDTDVNPERFMGLGPRFDDLSAANGGNIISGAGTGSDQTSIWLIGWGMNTCHGIFPKGSKMGLSVTDQGQVTIQDEDGGYFEGYRTHYKWDIGFTVRDWRYVVRIANVDTGNLTIDKSGTSADLEDLMIQAMNVIQSTEGVKLGFYCNRTVRSFLERQAIKDSNRLLGMQDFGGRLIPTFRGVPINLCEAILDTESQIS